MGLLLLSTTICFSVSVPGCGAAWRLGLPVLVTSAPADAVDWSVVGSFSADSPPPTPATPSPTPLSRVLAPWVLILGRLLLLVVA